MTVYRFANLIFDSDAGILARADNGQKRPLRPQVGAVLSAFLEQPQTLIGREQLYRAVWDEAAVVDFEAGLAAILRELRRELKALDAPADLIATTPRRGYRLQVPVQRGQRAPARLSPTGRRRLLGLAAALVVLIIAGLLAWPGDRSPPVAEQAGQSLAVVPFTQFGEPDHGPPRLDLLLADQILVRLWELRPEGLILIGRASMAPYRDHEDLALAVAEHLGVDLLVEGTVVFEDKAMVVSARLLELPRGHILWSESHRYGAADTPAVATIAATLADSLVAEWARAGRD